MSSTNPLIIFDCDGVLVDTELIAYQVDAQELRSAGIAITAELLASRFGGVPFLEEYRILEAETGIRLPVNFANETHALILTALEAVGPTLATPFIHQTLDVLTHYATCVASSSSFKWLSSVLGAAGLWERFHPHIYSAVQVQHGKPAPDLFLFSAAQMHRPAAQCLVIEDSIAGIQAAKMASMEVLGFCGGSHCSPDHASQLLAAGATLVFCDMRHLPELLRTTPLEPFTPNSRK